ncbi:S8 family peptidase [Myceligenerans salitolerans]|uniref:S8/S53 family peptidase n=1 Tax=Myceligenerans salitolerans TaxID=1230528 RepID=A0ABS3I6U1_9MICO|nr:S8/S53 family peptidase [Myceligenerans salitolerans]MBO0608703.1 S8/S53 family peptidase [Myceligenerans salitolerans]
MSSFPETPRVRDHTGGWRPVRDLDPESAHCRRQVPLAPTRYVADRLILRTTPGDDPDPLLDLLRERAAERSLELAEERLERAGSRGGAPQPGLAVHLAGDDGDVWDLLDDIASAVDPDERKRIGLDHVLVGHRNGGGLPVPGDREPAHRIGPAPRRLFGDGPVPWRTEHGMHRPVVAVVDTGIGEHPWLDGDRLVIRDAEVDGRPLGTYTEDEPDTTPDGLTPFAGHGTFIAGVVHQTCPDAAILPVRAMSTDGLVREWDLIRTMERLLEYHLRGLAGDPRCAPVDVLVLAMGFRPEIVEDDDYEGVLRGALRDLRRAGVLVVVSAGNDGDDREIFPAAWAPHVRRLDDRAEPLDVRDLHPDYPPILSVAASNPNGTLADFSNDGPWVTCVRHGREVVSTMPVTADGPLQPQFLGGDPVRESTDPDDYTGGFAQWSGTSFAAPVLAGELAQQLLDQRYGGEEGHRVRMAWRAVEAVTGMPEPVAAR